MTNYIQSIRKFIGTERLFVPGVRTIVVDRQGAVLLQRRTDVSLWGLPAGSVELEESSLRDRASIAPIIKRLHHPAGKTSLAVGATNVAINHPARKGFKP